MKKKYAIASDHGGFKLKEFLKKELEGFDWIDLGPSSDQRVDYPDFAKAACDEVIRSKLDGAVLVCGSGIGMAISANKIKGIRAAVVESEITARLAKQHNNANVLCVGARIVAPEYAKDIINAWANALFEGGRHEVRVGKISSLDKT